MLTSAVFLKKTAPRTFSDSLREFLIRSGSQTRGGAFTFPRRCTPDKLTVVAV